jgi:hypothetical protein
MRTNTEHFLIELWENQLIRPCKPSSGSRGIPSHFRHMEPVKHRIGSCWLLLLAHARVVNPVLIVNTWLGSACASNSTRCRKQLLRDTPKLIIKLQGTKSKTHLRLRFYFVFIFVSNILPPYIPPSAFASSVFSGWPLFCKRERWENRVIRPTKPPTKSCCQLQGNNYLNWLISDSISMKTIHSRLKDY